MLAVALHWKPGHESGIDLLFLLSRKQSITCNKISTVNKKWYPFIEQCHSGFQQQSYYSINWTLHIGFHVCMYAYQYPWLLISGTINSSLPCYGTGQLEGERKRLKGPLQLLHTDLLFHSFLLRLMFPLLCVILTYCFLHYCLFNIFFSHSSSTPFVSSRLLWPLSMMLLFMPLHNRARIYGLNGQSGCQICE